jgi:hypothetical protein
VKNVVRSVMYVHLPYHYSTRFICVSGVLFSPAMSAHSTSLCVTTCSFTKYDMCAASYEGQVDKLFRNTETEQPVTATET